MDDLRLKACFKEIEAVMEKYDAGGFVILASPEAGEYKFVNPRWSILKFPANGNFEGGRGWLSHRAATAEKTTYTVHMMQVINQSAAKAFIFTDSFIGQAEKHFKISGEPEFE